MGRTGRRAGHTRSPRRWRAARGRASTCSTAHFHPGRQNQRAGLRQGLSLPVTQSGCGTPWAPCPAGGHWECQGRGLSPMGSVVAQPPPRATPQPRHLFRMAMGIIPTLREQKDAGGGGSPLPLYPGQMLRPPGARSAWPSCSFVNVYPALQGSGALRSSCMSSPH